MRVEAWLDEAPGETRGIVARDGRFERLILHRESMSAAERLGARSVGRVSVLAPRLKGAFVELSGSVRKGFLPLKGGIRLTEGQAVEVEVAAEARGGKGTTLKLAGLAEGPTRLLVEGPSVRDWLARWAPSVAPVEGLAAIRAGDAAAEEALAAGAAFPEQGVDLAVERTRALVAVDIDHAGGGKRLEANRFGLEQAARLIRLKAWGGLIAIDLAGSGHDGVALARQAQAAFAPDGEVQMGPVSRFGLIQLAVPWSRAPIEEILGDTPETRALSAVRALRAALLADTAAPRVTARVHPEEAAWTGPWVARLGPRAHLIADPATPPGRFRLES